MAERSTPTVPTPTADQRRIAAENFERARQVLLTGNHDYGISLLTTCCKLDPANVLQHLFLVEPLVEHDEIERLVLVGQFADGLKDLLVRVEVEVLGTNDLLDRRELVRVAEDAAQHPALGVLVVRRQSVGQ